MSHIEAIPVMSKAKARMLMKHVFFASLLLSTKVVAVPGCRTAFTDMTIIGYDPDFIESLKDPDLVLFVLAHEMMHIVFKHGFNQGSRDHRRLNIAQDYVINWMLADNGFKLWDKCFKQRDFRSMSAELAQSNLRLLPSKDPYVGMSAFQLYDHLVEDGKGGGEGGMGDGGLGSDVRKPENLDAEEQSVIERKIERIVAQAASMARMAGKMSANLDRLINGVLNPPLPWQELLKEYTTCLTRDEETWAHRDRRRPNVYLPSMQGYSMGEVVVIGDTSGSIDGQMFAQIGAEIAEIMELVKPERVRIVWADDAEVCYEEVFERHDEIVLHPKGGGGTDMRKPLNYVERYDPIMVILVTDGYTPWPAQEPPYPLITVCSTNAHCPVGQVVRLKP